MSDAAKIQVTLVAERFMGDHSEMVRIAYDLPDGADVPTVADLEFYPVSYATLQANREEAG